MKRIDPTEMYHLCTEIGDGLYKFWLGYLTIKSESDGNYQLSWVDRLRGKCRSCLVHEYTISRHMLKVERLTGIYEYGELIECEHFLYKKLKQAYRFK